MWTVVKDLSEEKRKAIDEFGFNVSYVIKLVGLIRNWSFGWSTVQLHDNVYPMSSKEVKRLMAQIDDRSSSPEKSDCMESIGSLRIRIVQFHKMIMFLAAFASFLIASQSFLF